MLASLQQPLPEQWRETFNFVASGFTWLLDAQRFLLAYVVTGRSVGEIAVKGVFLLLPTAVLVMALWCTMASIYTLPFRSGRGGFLWTNVMAWWDVLRMTVFYWAGLLRAAVALVGWFWMLLKLAGSLFLRLVRYMFLRPFALLDWATRQYFQPGVPWIAFVFILFWSALEATIFTFTLRPTLTEVLADMTGTELSSIAMVVILWPFLFILISGSFAAIQALSEAIKAKQTSQIITMALIEAFVMFFEVMFLYRELIDSITPWIAQQTGFQLGFFWTLALASFGWVGVRAMTWFLFGRFGTPALLGILARQNIAGAQGATTVETPLGAEFWRGPITALKAEAEWFKQEAQRAFELVTLPVLQLLAAGLNYVVVVIRGRPTFTLPFKSWEQVAAGTPLLSSSHSGEHPVPRAAA